MLCASFEGSPRWFACKGCESDDGVRGGSRGVGHSSERLAARQRAGATTGAAGLVEFTLLLFTEAGEQDLTCRHEERVRHALMGSWLLDMLTARKGRESARLGECQLPTCLCFSGSKLRNFARSSLGRPCAATVCRFRSKSLLTKGRLRIWDSLSGTSQAAQILQSHDRRLD